MMQPGHIVDALIRMGIPVTDFEEDEVLIREGTIGNTIYILHQGEVSVTQCLREIVIIADMGATLGEVAALLGIQRTATVTTTRRSTFFVLEDLPAFLESHPDFARIMLKNMAQQIIDRDKSHVGVYIGLKKLREMDD